MGLLSNLLFFPVTAPVAGIRWSLGQVQTVVQQELTSDAPIKEELMELQMRLELEEIDDAEYLAREAEIMHRLRDVREWRERFGMGTSGGPVRVAADATHVAEFVDDDDAPDDGAGAPGADSPHEA